MDTHQDPTSGDAPEQDHKRPHSEPSDSPVGGHVTKKARVEDENEGGRIKGIAPIKKQYLIHENVDEKPAQSPKEENDVGESPGKDPRDRRGGRDRNKKQRGAGGQNILRSYGRHDDSLKLCSAVAHSSEFSPKTCVYGERCNKCHDLRKYLADGRRADLETFGGKCPVSEKNGRCSAGWRCRFVKSHSAEIEREGGRKELVLVYNDDVARVVNVNDENDEHQPGVVNIISFANKVTLNRKKAEWPKSNPMIKWDEEQTQIAKKVKKAEKENATTAEEARAMFKDPPLKPSEKRRLYFGPETPVLAPLTTQGNLPFRRLCVELGAQLTYSEMAMGLPMIQGAKADWALMKAHETELSPPKFDLVGIKPTRYVVQDYDNSRDFKFGAQISGTQPWIVTKATEALTRYLPHLRLVDLNCGCPIDMVYKAGGGSGLLDCPAKLERMVRGMNTVSGDVPITAKLRMGIREGRPTAKTLIDRLAFGGAETRSHLGAPGCAAVTLHGRSRQQRYTKVADWSFIAECAALVQSYREKNDDLMDTVREPDPSTLSSSSATSGGLYFIGNGDCYSHIDYKHALSSAKVDTVMIGRGALIKPWIFEEIEAGQYLDKSATERLAYVEKFCRYGLECWGSDELGIGFTRRFLLEWLSFTYRYIPIGLLEYLPPSLNDRPPAYKARNDLEQLLASSNYKDWVKISEMFLGPAHPDFKFQPKHKSNNYDMEAEG